jgi:thiamine-phosphate pyrophosphorylase
MLVTDRKLAGGVDALVRAVAAAVDGGANAVQLREKDLAPAELLPLARRLREVTAGRALLLVNGPLEIALEAGADGVHLPEDAPMVGRPSPEFVVGRSVHSLEAAQRAAAEEVDYVVAGPVYATRSHPGAPAAGVEHLSRIAAALPVPVIAIGGITADRTAEVIRAGAAGVAVISAILGAAKPPGAAREIAETLLKAWAGTRGAEVAWCRPSR